MSASIDFTGSEPAGVLAKALSRDRHSVTQQRHEQNAALLPLSASLSKPTDPSVRSYLDPVLQQSKVDGSGASEEELLSRKSTDSLPDSLETSKTVAEFPGKDIWRVTETAADSVHVAKGLSASRSGSTVARDDRPTLRGVASAELSRQPASPAREVDEDASEPAVHDKESRSTDSLEEQSTGLEKEEAASVVVCIHPSEESSPNPAEQSQTGLPADEEASETVAEVESQKSTSDSFQSLLGNPLARPKLSVRVDEVDGKDLPLTELENVTSLSRSLIPQELLRPPRRKRPPMKMTNSSSSALGTNGSNKTSSNKPPKKSRNIFRRNSFRGGKKTENRDDAQDPKSDSAARPLVGSDSLQLAPNQAQRRGKSAPSAPSHATENGTRRGRAPRTGREQTPHTNSEGSDPSFMSAGTEETPIKSNKGSGEATGKPPRPNIVQRIRAASRSRSRSRSRRNMDADEQGVKPMLVAVTSCRSDAYYNQKAPGSTSKLPRKAPSNLKLFHELAVGVKDAYAALGETPERPDVEEPDSLTEAKTGQDDLLEGKMVLWEFMGNLDFLLALVDEVATDTATRGALKDDTTFKCLRDVIKKGNKVLEAMLVRRERKYTLFFRLVQPSEANEIAIMKSWNGKVEKAVGAVADSRTAAESEHSSETDNETASIASASTSASSASGRSRGMFSRGRQLLPTAGRVRARRATPTPALRNKRGKQTSVPNAVAAEDGYAAVTAPVTQGNLAMLQRSLDNDTESGMNNAMKLNLPTAPPKQQLAPVKPVEPKDELVDVIRGLREEKMNRAKGTAESDLATLKPNWQPKAEIPTAVPKLPMEYIHRHRLMKQVVNCLLDRSGAGPRDMDDETSSTNFITAITSRHGDKPGNGKTTLAVAAIQTVEVRERFSDGIAWIQLGRTALTEKDVRRLYEELYRQLIMKDSEAIDDDTDDNSSRSPSQDKPVSRASSFASLENLDKNDDTNMRYSIMGQLADNRRRFQSGDLEGAKEDLGRMLSKRKILICLDDVWRVEDAKWFIFDTNAAENSNPATRRASADDPHQYRILITTRTPSLLGPGIVQEVFVRIFSEAEAVKLLLSSAGRRPYGGKNSKVFNEARVIVKGCGNSPLAVRLAGGMLRRSNRNWNLSSPTWTTLMKQCKLNLDEASRLRSFVNSAKRVVDLTFVTVEELAQRAALRRCFVSFAMAFRDNDWVLLGRGIPQAVVLKLFGTVISAGREASDAITPELVLSLLEQLNLLQRARHGCTTSFAKTQDDDDSPSAEQGSSGLLTFDESFGEDKSERPASLAGHETPSFVMQDSIKTIAEEMATRLAPSFMPTADEFTSFASEIEDEKNFVEASSGRLWSAPLRYLGLTSKKNGQSVVGMDEHQVAELVVASLMGMNGSIAHGSITDAFQESILTTVSIEGGAKMEEYMGTFLPTHLIQAKAYATAADLLVDPHFIKRRVAALGAIESTRRQVADLLELRREVGNKSTAPSSPRRSKRSAADMPPPLSPVPSKENPISPHSPHSPNSETGMESDGSDQTNIDANAIMREGSRRIVDEVYRVVNVSSGSSDSLTMAICLSSIGEGLLKCRQPRDAMLRLEEAVGIYRGLLGTYHIDVARALHSVAKALVRLGETRVALLKFSEAGKIYEKCNATLHYDSISNAQNMASLLVELGEWGKAESKFEEVISMKKAVHGENSVVVAKAINSYAILLAKHGRMKQALRHYEAAQATYAAVPPGVVRDPDFELKCKYDVTLIILNIASIKSKKGDLQGAIDSYQEGVRGLREHEEQVAQLRRSRGEGDAGKSQHHHKHLVAALGRIGSLKLKLGDNDGALEIYTVLLNEVDEHSSAVCRTEKAKAHIKCATIYRQREGKEAQMVAISHLREALDMYTVLFGPDHKDTQAIASSLQQWLSEVPQIGAN